MCENSEPLHAVACHPKRPYVVMGNQSGILKVWDYNRKLTVCSRAFEIEKQIQCVTFDPEGESVSSALNIKQSHLFVVWVTD